MTSDELTTVDLRLDDDEPETGSPKLALSSSVGEPVSMVSFAESSKLEISIKYYEKRGEGMNAYIVYKVVTKAENVLNFANKEYEVWRRFSDFLGLHEKLMEKYFHKGIMVPPPPEKSLTALTKTIMNHSGDEHITHDFAERRSRALQRFCIRIARHPKLVSDNDFRDFLVVAAPLPKATSTAALSSASVKRMFKNFGEVFSKMAYHMDENDRWFENAQQQMEDMEQTLTKLLRAVEMIGSNRHELASGTELFSKALSMLASCEENTGLSRVLSHLTETQEKVSHWHVNQSELDHALLIEVIQEQLSYLMVMKELFFERVKVWQNWQTAQQNLSKKREQKARYELARKMDRVAQMRDELTNAEQQVDDVEREFAEVSKVIRGEYERYLSERKADIHSMFVKYVEGLLETQKVLLQQWERFAPETKAVVTQ
uniref:PX domain-containing protein n=1 Tax=Syphacia muris TaxID=451379 RepID=A0A158R3R3_9BILA